MLHERHLFHLPRAIIIVFEIFMVLLWAIIAFWGAIFLAKGFLDLNQLFLSDRIYALAFTLVGVYFLKYAFTYVVRVRTIGLRDIVQSFLDKRFAELVATTVFMLMTAFIAANNIQFIGTTILLLPLFIGTTFGISLGYFLTHIFGISFAPFIVFVSTWILELFWMYLFAKVVVKVITLFQLRSDID